MGKRGNVEWGNKKDGSGQWWKGTDENGNQVGGHSTFRNGEFYGHYHDKNGETGKITPGDSTNLPSSVKDVQDYADKLFNQ